MTSAAIGVLLPDSIDRFAVFLTHRLGVASGAGVVGEVLATDSDENHDTSSLVMHVARIIVRGVPLVDGAASCDASVDA